MRGVEADGGGSRLGEGEGEARLVFVQLPPTLTLLRLVPMTSGVVRGYRCDPSHYFPSCTLPLQNVLGVHDPPRPALSPP